MKVVPLLHIVVKSVTTEVVVTNLLDVGKLLLVPAVVGLFVPDGLLAAVGAVLSLKVSVQGQLVTVMVSPWVAV